MKRAKVTKVTVHCGSGCTGESADYEEGPAGRADAAGGLDPVEQDMLRRVVANAVREHARVKGIGTIPAGLRRWADQTLDPKVDWRRALESAVRRGVHLRAGASDYTWQRPSRRDDSGDPVIRPGMTRPVPDIAVVVDTSASMDEQDLERALAEIRGILTRVVPGDGLRVYSVDADVASVGQVFNTRQISLVGGGGTDMRVGIEAAIVDRPAVIIVITDGFTPWPETRPRGAPLTIAALTHPHALSQVPGLDQVDRRLRRLVEQRLRSQQAPGFGYLRGVTSQDTAHGLVKSEPHRVMVCLGDAGATLSSSERRVLVPGSLSGGY